MSDILKSDERQASSELVAAIECSAAALPQRPRFMLEVGQLSTTKMPYTYERRAQATLYQIQYKQAAFGQDKDALIEFFKRNYKPHRFSGRIIDWNTGETVFKDER